MQSIVRKAVRPFTVVLKGIILTLIICATGGAWADFAKTNPVTGETENYTWKFTGTDTWNGTGNWKNSSNANPSGTPAKSNEGTWDPILFDGNTINITASMSVEGWELRMGLYNGANVRMNTFVKWQSDNTPMWVTVDDTSKLTVGGFGKGNLSNEQVIKCSTTRENGIEWLVNLESTGTANNTFEYYLKGAGSVSYQAVSAANHKIRMADVSLSGEKTVKSKTLVSFTSTDKTFTADAAIKLKSGDAVLKTVYLTSVTSGTTTLTTDNDVGTCELVQTSTGIVLYWVDGDPNDVDTGAKTYKPSININFTHSGNGLSTGADVGLTDYEVPGTSWNNFAGANGTYSTVKAVDSTGDASTASGVSVEVSGARGSHQCSSLTASSNPLHGYIDENANNTTPTITVSGIPYDKYRVVVYSATDTANVSFGYLTINGSDYTYSNGTVIGGTTAWGASGAANSAASIAEGVNVLVSPVTLGSTLTVVGHRSGNNRGCIAAIQIVEYVPEVTENDLVIPVSDATEYPVNAAKTLSGTVYLTGSGTLTLSGSAKITAATIDVGENVILNVNAARLDATTFTGAGTVVYTSSAPVSGKGWTSSAAWTGILWIKNHAIAGLNPDQFANARSTLRLSGCTGYFNNGNNTKTCPGTLDLYNDSWDFAFSVDNGWSTNGKTIFAKLTGSGTLGVQSREIAQRYIFKDASGFTGNINLAGRPLRVIFGDGEELAPEEGTITVVQGATVTVASGTTWTANKNGFVVNGTLNVEGALSSSKSTSAISGSGTVVFNGKAPSPTGAAWWKNDAWKGTVEVKNHNFGANIKLADYGNTGSSLRMDGSEAYLSLDAGAHNIKELKIGSGGFKQSGGYTSGSLYDFNLPFKLTGTGTYTVAMTGSVSKSVNFQGDTSEFAGKVVFDGSAEKNRVVFGTSTSRDFQDKSLVVGANGVLKVAPNMQWTLSAAPVYVDQTGLLENTGGLMDVAYGFQIDGTVKTPGIGFAWNKMSSSTGFVLGDTGVLELTSTANVNDSSYGTDSGNLDISKVKGTGTLKYSSTAGWRAFPDQDARMPASTVAIQTELADSLIITKNNGETVIGSLSGSKNIRSDFGDNGANGRTLAVTQSKNTEWQGKFVSNRITKFKVVAPAAGTPGTLTMSGANDQSILMQVDGSVNLTGTWNGNTTVAGTFACSGTLTGNLTTQSGSTLDFSNAASGERIAGTLTLNSNTTVKFPSAAAFPFRVATSLASAVVLDASKFTIGGVPGAEGTTLTIGTNGYAYAPTSATIGANAVWSEIIWGSNYAAGADVSNADCALNVTESCTLALGSASAAKVTFNVEKDKILTLTGSITAGEICIKGEGTVLCSAADTLIGVLTGDGTVKYPGHTLPSPNTVFQYEGWRGTLILPYCGRLNNVAYDGTVAQTNVRFDNYGNANSKIKAPGFKGDAAVDRASVKVCQAELVIDEGTTVEFNHGSDSIISGETDVGFIFSKLSGSGTLRLDGTSDTVQYVFRNVSGFAGSVEITDPTPDDFTGGKKSFIFGVDAQWTIANSTYPAYLVVATSMTVAEGKHWQVPAGIVLLDDETLTLENNATISRIRTQSDFGGKLVVAADATATVDVASDGYMPAKINIASGAKLELSNTTIKKLTIPANVGVTYTNAGTLDLTKCSALKELHLDLGASNGNTIDLTKITLPDTCDTIYYDIGETVRNLSGYTVPSVGAGKSFYYYATETIAEYGADGREGLGYFTIQNVPAGASVKLLRRSGAEVDAAPTSSGSSTHAYADGSQFAGNACWHEWDFESETLADTGMYIDDANNRVALQPDSAAYLQVTVNTKTGSETKKAISSASKPYPASTTTFADNWSAAVRCSMPSTAGQVAVAFGNTTSGIIGLASGAQGFVDLFTWTSGTYTSLAQFKVESPSNDNNMHIYVFAVQYDSEKSKRYLSFYRDGEFIHKAEISVSSITTFMVGDVSGRGEYTNLPVAATDGYTDYVRLYNKVLDQSLVGALAARRPFASSKDTYEREVSVEGTWDEAGTWTKKGVGTTHASPADGQYVTVSVAQPASITVNLAEDSNYETLIFKGQGTISLSRDESSTGRVNAGMVVVRSGTVLRAAYNAVDFANVPVGVDEDAALQFDFSSYPFENVTEATSFFVTGPVVAAEYDKTVKDRISVVGGREHTWTLSGAIVRDGESGPLRYQVTIAPDHVPGGTVYYKEGTLAAGMTVYTDAALTTATTLFAGDNVIVSAASDTGDVTVDDTFNGVLTVQRTTVNLTSTGSAALAGKTVTVAENCTLNFAGGEFGAMMLAGAGSFAVTDDTAVTSLTGTVGINVPSSVTLTLGAVTPFVTGGVTGYGTVKLPEHSGSEGFDFSRYGSGGTIALASFTDYINTSKANVTSALRLDGNMTITAMSTTTYTFAKITGTGDLTFPSGNSPTITIANLEDYAGTIINNSSSAVTVTKLTKTGVYGAGDVLLTKDGTGAVNVSAVEIGGVAKYGYWVGNNYYIAAAGYGGQRYGTVTEAIDAAIAAGGDVSSIEVLDGSTSLPAGYAQYYIENGHVGKYDAAVICNTAEVYYYKTAQDAVDAVSLNYAIAGKYSYFEIYSANDVAIAVPASIVWDMLSIKIKRMNGIQVSVSAASADEVYAPNGEADENGAVAYAKTTLATDYYWAGATTSGESDLNKWAWARADNWRIGSSEGPKGSRSPSSIDTAHIDSNAYVSGISISDSLTITGSGAINASESISLTTAGAVLYVTGVTLSPAPTTTVENAMVDSVTEDGVTTYTVVTAAAEVNGTRYKTFAEALSAINAATGVVTVELLTDATLDLSRNGNVLGGPGVTKITINGNGNTLTFNQTEAWAQVNTANGAELVLNNVNLTNSIGFTPVGNHLYVYNHDISFNCVATLNNVTSDKALAFWKNVTLNEVSVAETEDAYSIWIHTTASSVAITNLVVNTAAGRGIKVDDAFVKQIGGTPSATALTIDGATFTTKESKSAVLVSSSCAISVAATGTIDISGVPADTTNLVWVDEASSANFGLVTVTGATIGVEKPDSYVATISTDTKVDGYYTTLGDKEGAITAAGANQIITLLKDDVSGSVASKTVTINLDNHTGSAFTLTTKDASVIVKGGTATVTTNVGGGAKVISTTSAGTTTYKVVYGTIFSVW